MLSLRGSTLSPYVGQLCSPPPDMLMLEMRGANAVWHAPPGTLSGGAAASLAGFGTYALLPPSVETRAAMVRFAFRTTEWKAAFQSLMVDADERGIGLGRQIRGEWWASHWRSPAMAANLHNVFHDRAPTLDPLPTASRVFAAAKEEAVAWKETHSLPAAGFQRAIRKCLLPLVLPASIEGLIQERLWRHTGVQVSLKELVVFRKKVAQLHGRAPTSILKTVLGGWTTSARNHENPIRECLVCGAELQDRWSHCARCKKCWASLSPPLEIEGVVVTLDQLSVADRLGLGKTDVRWAAVAFEFYALVRNVHSETLRRARVRRDKPLVAQVLSRAASAARAVAGGLQQALRT